MLTYIVSKEEDGEKLLSFLRKKINGQYPVKWIKRGIDGRLCRIDGKVEVFSTHSLRQGQKISYDEDQLSRFEKARPTLIPSILYEDEDLLICDKPSKVASDSEELKAAFHKSGLILCHRLDKGTSGALVFAKNEETHEGMKVLFARRIIKKGYLAIVDGNVKERHGTIDISLGVKRRIEGQVFWGPSPLDRGGKEAITEWYCLNSGKEASFLRCFPKTGRTHQIRIHLNKIGHPILGDDQYGKHFSCPYPAPRVLLHASYLSFLHPGTKKPIEIKTPIPADFKSALKALLLLT